MTRTAESMGITFRELPPAEVVSVRRDVGKPEEAYLGKLVRPHAGSPVHADEDLARHLGCPLTTADNATMHEAKAQCLSMLAVSDAQRTERGKVTFDFEGGLPDRDTWLRLWDSLHSTGDSAVIRVGDT